MVSDDYRMGRRAARRGIGAGVPRWSVVRVSGSSSEEIDSIDKGTGLPVIVIHIPKELAAQQAEFTRGHNEEILAAIASGEIARDFRPLLMSAREVDRAFKQRSLGRLDMKTPRLELPDLDMALEIKVPKPRRGPPPRFAGERLSMIVLHRKDEKPEELLVYEGPVEVAVVRDGRVLIVRFKDEDLLYDLETTQILTRHARRRS